MNNDITKYEKDLYKQGYKYIAGTDEAGRGPLAGPVVAAAVILKDVDNELLNGLTDSKKLSAKKRSYYFDIIKEVALAYVVTIISPKEIDDINIYQASKKGMEESINNLKTKPDYVLTDAMPLTINIPHLPIIKGDAKSITIAAASVLAKVTRDNLMDELDKEYPMYGFKKHKGYPTKAHIEALNKYGIIKEHRKTYGPVKDLLKK